MSKEPDQEKLPFADHFSGHSTDYAKYRPGYPPALFELLHALTAIHDVAWDVGTGNGQAAVALAKFFQRVVATDPSLAQIANAKPHPRVTYNVQAAEQCDLADASVDLATVAQAVHWFDFERFYAQVKRVLKPGGVLAVWTYALCKVTLGVDAVTRHLYADIVGPYWPPERRYTESSYRDIPFPFAEISIAPLFMVTHWTLADYVGYLRTWSSTQRYIKERQSDPVEAVMEPLRQAWGDPASLRAIEWPIHMRVGRSS